MKKRLTIFFTLFTISVMMMAVPAKRTTKTVRQIDGSLLNIYLKGDESLHYYATEDGLALFENENGSYCYAHVKDGQLCSTGILAHDIKNRSIDESSYLNFASSTLNAGINALRAEQHLKRNTNRIARASKVRSLFRSTRLQSASKVSSTKRGLVILVNFKDKKMVSSAPTKFYNQFNQTGYSENNHIGSVRDYFIDQSSGQLTINFDVVGPYELADSMRYYGRNKSNGDDMYAAKMVAEACKAADKDVDYNNYDWDGDGEADQVYVIYAGYGEASGAPSITIWPHEWDLDSAKSSGDGPGALTLDGTTVNTYACSNELSGTSGSVLDGIGTACHEFSHCLGLPDFYDTDGNNFGMSNWSLMDYGCYNGPTGYEGNVPCAYTAYERYYTGWIEPTVLNEGCTVSNMRPFTESDDSYIIYNDANHDEYYILFNIQKKSWNKYAKGHGMLVMHIDYDPNIWFNNTVNNYKNRQRCTIIPADNSLSSSTLAGDPFPGTSNNKSLTNDGTPQPKLYNKNTDGSYLLNKPITEITEEEGLISFIFNGGEPLNVPVALEATEVGHDTFIANWSSVEQATGYTIELSEQVETPLTKLIDEDFSGLASLNSNTDVSETIDNYMQTKGWSGTNLNSTHQSNIKLGKAGTIGSITTPKITGATSGKITLYIVSHPYLSSQNSSFSVMYGNKSTLISSSNESKTAVFDTSSLSNSITISTIDPTRAYIDHIVICDGEANAEQVEALLSSGKTSDIFTTTKSTIYTGIQDLSYLFKDLTSGEYEFRVKAYNEEKESEWSNWIKVILDVESAIKTIDYINFDIETKVYTISGMYIGNWNNNLPEGVYVVKQGNSVRKVIKRNR